MFITAVCVLFFNQPIFVVQQVIAINIGGACHVSNYSFP